MSPRFPACSKGGLIPTEPIGWCPGGSGGRVALGFDFAYTPRGMLRGPAGDPNEMDDHVPPDHLPCLQESHLGRLRPASATGNARHPEERALHVYRRGEGCR